MGTLPHVYESREHMRARVCSELKLPSPMQKDAAQAEKTKLEELATDKFFLWSNSRFCRLIGDSRAMADRPARSLCGSIRKEELIAELAFKLIKSKNKDHPGFKKAVTTIRKMDEGTAGIVIEQALHNAMYDGIGIWHTMKMEGLVKLLWEQMLKNYPATIQRLAKALKNPVVIERNWAAAALKHFGALASRVRPQLIKALFDKDSSDEARASILETLKEMRSKENAPVFTRILTEKEHENKEYRVVAVEALSDMDPKAYTGLFARLVNKGMMSFTNSVVDALVKDDSRESTLALAQAFKGFGSEACGKAEEELIRRAMRGSNISLTVPILAETLGDKKAHPFSQMSAARVLGYAQSREAVYPLLVALKFDASPATRATAADALGRLNFEESAYWLLDAALNDKETSVKEHAILALGRRGENAEWARPDLERIQKEKAPVLGNAVTKALAMMGSKEAFDVLAKVVSGKVLNPASIIEILEIMMKSDHDAAYPLAEKYLKELRDSEICYTLAPHIRTNGTSSSFAAIAIPILKSFALSESYADHIREQLIRAIGRIGNESAIKALAAIESNAKSQEIKRIAAEELRKICNPVQGVDGV